MSLAGSPVHSSSSSDDFAALLDAELESSSTDSSPEAEVDEVEGEGDDGSEEDRVKRQKVELSEESLQIIEETCTSRQQTKTCTHPGFFKGLCMKCGQTVEDDKLGVPLSYIHKDLKLGAVEIDRLRGADLKNLLREEKLILILDLDHTLLNSTRLIDVSSEERYLLEQATAGGDDPNRSLFKLESMHMLTKLRPFVRTFLSEASRLFEMYIYTMAERSYALEMAKLLDPGKVYFNSKVISQSDCTQRHLKGLDVILGAESTVLIIDDTEMVWQKHKENLILMERYHFFSSNCRQFSFIEKSLSELKQDERESDGALATILNVLKRVHQMFFDEVKGGDLSSSDVRQVVRNIRKEVLAGCKIVFSRLFPSNATPENQQIWKMCEQLGATCCAEVGPTVTHVVSVEVATEKARWALENEKFLVHPRWVDGAYYLWRRLPEEDFPISKFKNMNT
uniref:RNA polymerase II C-terminal domain phosphatase-like n=1 Tax=Anthurium amnicola TaxID=1678845 RepID=A0A1D1YIC0_9ARAE